jgi:hypothetical protein
VESTPLIPSETGRALLIIAVFLLPGFVTQLFKERMYEARAPAPTFERLLETLYYSLLVYLPLAVAAAFLGWDKDKIEGIYEIDEGLWPLLGVSALSGLGLPALIAYVGARWDDADLRFSLIKRFGLRPTHRTPTAWDHFFGIEEQAFVRVTTRTGEILGGYFGPFSFAGYGSQGRERDLYVQEQWELDAEKGFVFLRPAPQSMGVWIDGSDIVNVEFFAVSEEEADGFKEAAEGRTSD